MLLFRLIHQHRHWNYESHHETASSNANYRSPAQEPDTVAAHWTLKRTRLVSHASIVIDHNQLLGWCWRFFAVFGFVASNEFVGVFRVAFEALRIRQVMFVAPVVFVLEASDQA